MPEESCVNKTVLAFGIVEFILAIGLITCGIFDIYFQSYLYFAGHGIWGGLFVLLTAIFAIAAGTKRLTCLHVTHMVLAILACTLLLPVVQILFQVEWMNNYVITYSNYGAYYGSNNGYMEHYRDSPMRDSSSNLSGLAEPLLLNDNSKNIQSKKARDYAYVQPDSSDPSGSESYVTLDPLILGGNETIPVFFENATLCKISTLKCFTSTSTYGYPEATTKFPDLVPYGTLNPKIFEDNETIPVFFIENVTLCNFTKCLNTLNIITYPMTTTNMSAINEEAEATFVSNNSRTLSIEEMSAERTPSSKVVLTSSFGDRRFFPSISTPPEIQTNVQVETTPVGLVNSYETGSTTEYQNVPYGDGSSEGNGYVGSNYQHPYINNNDNDNELQSVSETSDNDGDTESNAINIDDTDKDRHGVDVDSDNKKPSDGYGGWRGSYNGYNGYNPDERHSKSRHGFEANVDPFANRYPIPQYYNYYESNRSAYATALCAFIFIGFLYIILILSAAFTCCAVCTCCGAKTNRGRIHPSHPTNIPYSMYDGGYVDVNQGNMLPDLENDAFCMDQLRAFETRHAQKNSHNNLFEDGQTHNTAAENIPENSQQHAQSVEEPHQFIFGQEPRNLGFNPVITYMK